MPGGATIFSKISFTYRWLEDVKNMEVVLKVVHCKFVYQTVSSNREVARFHSELPSNGQYAPNVGVIKVIIVDVNRQPMI